MADNITLNSGSGGATIAADDVASVWYQRVKLTDGTADSTTAIASGDGTNTNALRVTVASDSSPLSVDDNGSTLSVDDGAGSLTVDNAGTFAVQVDGNALTALQLIDDPVVADDAAFTPATTKVMMAGFEFNDVTPDSVNEGDAGAARMSANRNIYVNIRDNAGNERGLNVDANGAIAVTDGAASLTVDNSTLSVVGGGTEATALRVTLASDSTGVVSVDDNGGSLTVDNGGTFAVQESGSALTALQLIDNLVLAEDAAHVTADPGVQALAVRKATPVNLSDTDGDYEPLQINAGRLWTDSSIGHIAGNAVSAGNGTSGTGVLRVAQVSDGTGVLAGVTTVTTLTGGGVAHDGADSGNPIKIGAKVETSPKGITVPADGDRTDLYADSDGMLMVKVGTSGADLISERVSDTGGTSTAFTNFSAVASTYNYVTAYSVFRTDAGTSPIYVDFRDGAAGSVKWSVVIPPNGGANLSSAVPLFKTSANTALAYDVSAATTTVYISISGYQSKV